MIESEVARVVRHTSRKCNQFYVCSESMLETPRLNAYNRAVAISDEEYSELFECLSERFQFRKISGTFLQGKLKTMPTNQRASLVEETMPTEDEASFSIPFEDESYVAPDSWEQLDFVAEADSPRRGMPSESVSLPQSRFDRFCQLTEEGDYFNACQEVLHAVESQEEDVPIRDSEWFVRNKVTPPRSGKPSTAYNLADWRFSSADSGLPSPNFFKNCVRVAESAVISLGLLKRFPEKYITPEMRRQVENDVKCNPYVVYMTNMEDAKIAGSDGNEKFFQNLYTVREFLSLDGDYGFKDRVGIFVAEGASASSLAEMFDNVKESAKDYARLPLREMASRAVDRVWDVVSKLLELVTKAYKSFMGKVRQLLRNFIIKAFDLEDLVHFAQSEEFKAALFLFFSITVLIFAVGCTIISYNVAFGMVSGLRKVSETFRAEADIHPATFAATLAAGVFGLSTQNEAKIAGKARYLCTLIAGGTVAANLGACCFSLLPEVLKDALQYKFGTTESRLKRESNQWRATANALIHLSTVPRVVSSEIYIQKIKECMSQGSMLLNKINGHAFNTIRAGCLSTFVRLQKIHMNIVQFITGTRTRDEPFCVHIFGRPGIGKSTLEKKLQAKAFGILPHESYPMSFDDEHHSGYMNHRSVVIDEFLVGPQTLQEKTASIFLKLKSSAQVKLDMPTLDNVFVGVKGAEFDSEIIVTMSNTAYPRVASFESSAIQRRRDVVVEFEVAPGYESHIKGNFQNPTDAFDIAALDADTIRRTTWVKARCLPNVYRPDVDTVATPWMDFDVLCEYLGQKFEEKKNLSEILKESMGGIQNLDEDPLDLINEELRKTCSLPSKPVSVMEAFASIFSSEDFKAEAPERHHHKCGNCTETYRHKVEAEEVQCHKCGHREFCMKGTSLVPFTEAEVVSMSANDRVSVVTASSCPPDAHFHACLNPRCDKKRACNSKRNSLNWVCEECVKRHETSDPKYFRGWAMANYNASSKDAVPPSEVFSSFEDWQKCCAERILLDLSTAWDALPATYSTIAGETVGSALGGAAIRGLILGIMFGIAHWISGAKTIEDVSFSPQSDLRNKKSHRGRRRSRWSRGDSFDSYESEAMKAIKTGQLNVGYNVLTCIPLAERWVLTYAHGLFEDGIGVKPGSDMQFLFNDQVYQWKCSPDDFILCRDDNGDIELDIAFVRIGDKRCPAFRNVLSCFATEEEIPHNRFRVSMRTKSGLVMTYAEADVQDYSYENTRFHLTDGFRYDAHTVAGDCGSPLLLAAGPNITKCLGIHVAGSLSKTNPVGLSVKVTREIIEDAIGDLIDRKSFIAESCLLDRLEETESPNLVTIEECSFYEAVHLSNKTKLTPSIVSEFLPFETTKQPAILDRSDPRSGGKDPVEEAIVRLAKADKVELDVEILAACEDDLYVYLDRALDYSKTGGLRELSFDEAVFGIPGALSSVCTSTNAGSPFCYFVTKRGKRELIWFEGTEGKVDPNFREHVLRTLEEVRSGIPLDKVFLGFQKDEVRSKSKIDDVNTRITYSNDVTYNVVCRMLFGAMVTAFNSSFPAHPYALGINPSSFDANKIYHRVRNNSNRLVAGDFKEFDLRHQRQIMDSSFKILKKLGASLDRSEIIFEHVRVHETEVPFLIGRWKLRTVCNNASGGFWTTILNCITADLYFRYTFKLRHPGRIFEQFVSLVILGDDHLTSVSEEIEWNPLQIRDDMKIIGQLYTSAVKDRELTSNYEKFDEVLFLGHYFRIVCGRWSGALRKPTLEESVLWTRNNNKTIVEECQQMMEYASQWDEKYFNYYCASINKALVRVGLNPVFLPPWSSLRRTVAERVTENSTNFQFVAEANGDITLSQTGPAEHAKGLVTVATDTDVVSQDAVRSGRAPLQEAVSEDAGSMDMGTESFVRRGQWNWSTSDSVGAQIAGFAPISVPYGLLGLGDQANIQNMGFQNFQFSEPDVEIKVQLNGSPTQAGCLVAYFVPLSDVDPQYVNWVSLPHVKLSPCDNSTGTIRIPFRYWRTLLDNQLAHDTEISLGTFRLGVYSPLVSLSSPQNCGVTIFSRFVSSQRIPRTMPPSKTNTRPKYGFTRGTGTLNGRLLSSDLAWSAQGGNVSTTNVKNTYSIGDVAGNMPVEAYTEMNGNSQSSAQKAQVSVPLDNPPVVGGGVPVVQQFPSMSKTNGPESTTGLYLHPEEMNRQPLAFRDSEETTIENLLARPGRIFSFPWSTGQADGSDLYSFNMDSIMFDDGGSAWNVVWDMPCNIAILNMFKFMHFDVVFSAHVVRTRFHSGRLQASISYSMFDDMPAQKTALYNNILDYNGDNSVCEFVVPWNSSQEFIRANENKLPGPSMRIGNVAFSVLNELRVTSEVVASSVDVIIEISFRNVRVAVPNPYSVVQMGEGYTRVSFIAQSGGSAEETSDVNVAGESIVTTATHTPPPVRLCRVSLGQKFEYVVGDVHEVVRRYTTFPISWLSVVHAKQPTSTNPTTIPASNNRSIYRIPCEPPGQLNFLFAGWSGMQKFRIYANTASHCTVSMSLSTRPSSGMDNDFSHVLTLNSGTVPNPGGVGGIQAPIFGGYMAREVMYPLGSQSFIDVSVPFSTEFNFLPTFRNTSDNVGPRGVGYLYVNVPVNADIVVYWAAGDDFRYHVYSPTRGFKRKLGDLSAGGAYPTGDIQIAGIQATPT